MSDQTQQSNQLNVTQQTGQESSAMAQQLPGPALSTMANEPDRSQLEFDSVDDLQQTEDRSLSGLLSNRREQLESVFSIDLIYTIDLLFNLKGGPCLRYEIAHGKLASGACYLHSSIHAC